MTRFVARRIRQSAIVVLLVAVIVFVLTHLLPGGPARAILGQRATPVEIAAFNHQMGYDRAWPVQLVTWMGHVVTFRFGVSYKLNQSVGALIAERLPKTLALMSLSLVLAVLLSIPLASYQATHRNKAADHAATGFAFTFYAMPQYFLGLVLILIFSIKLHLAPPEAPQGQSLGQILSQPRALILPVLTLTLVQIALFSRFLRSAIIDNLYQDYVRTARACGASERRIMVRHVLRNSLIPLVTLVGLLFPQVLAGALIVETVFNYPGMGLLFWQAAQNYDYPVLLGVTVIVAVATVLGNLFADVAYAVLDPRVRYSTS